VQILEQPDTVTEQDGDEVDLELIEEARRQVLPRDARAAPDPDVLPPAADFAFSRAASSPSVSKLYVVPPFLGSGSRRSWVITNTGIPKGGGSPHWPTPSSKFCLPIKIAPVASWSSSTTSASARGLAVEHPLVESLAVVSERVSDGHVRAGDEAIKRHRQVEVDLAHAKR
jgi:hypothetical protein